MREPPDRFADVDVDANGRVILNRKGLSVVDDWRRLPGHLIPEHLDDGLNGASGKNMRVFVHGVGSFGEGVVSDSLQVLLKIGSLTSGVIAPRAWVTLANYQTELAAIRGEWVIDES